jgi:hypothetical protein
MQKFKVQMVSRLFFVGGNLESVFYTIYDDL